MSDLALEKKENIVEDPASAKKNLDKVTDLLNNIGMKVPAEWTKSAVGEYGKLFEQIKGQNMDKMETMSFLDGKIAGLKNSADTLKVRQATNGSVANVMKAVQSEAEKNEPFLTKEQRYMVIMGLAILAAIVALAYINPVWAAKAVLALIGVLGGVVVVNKGKSKPEDAVKELIPGSKKGKASRGAGAAAGTVSA